MNDFQQIPYDEADGAQLPSRRPRIAVVVSNPCNPDYRVIKQAEFLASQGYEVRIFCTQARDIPSFETFNGVSYRRIRWHVGEALSRLMGISRPDPLEAIRANRARFMKRYSSLFRADAER